jgi:hypothetical protein
LLVEDIAVFGSVKKTTPFGHPFGHLSFQPVMVLHSSLLQRKHPLGKRASWPISTWPAYGRWSSVAALWHESPVWIASYSQLLSPESGHDELPSSANSHFVLSSGLFTKPPLQISSLAHFFGGLQQVSLLQTPSQIVVFGIRSPFAHDPKKVLQDIAVHGDVSPNCLFLRQSASNFSSSGERSS